nr:hypothetical protein [uncultured Desulfobulbus sp.]
MGLSLPLSLVSVTAVRLFAGVKPAPESVTQPAPEDLYGSRRTSADP